MPGNVPESGEWRLGHEPAPARPEPLAPTPAAEAPDRSDARLAHPLFTITFEHLGWFLIAAIAVATRAIDLAGRPLSGSEARDALAAFDIAKHGLAAASNAIVAVSWPQLAEAGLFSAAGANDLAARVVAIVCGLIVIASAFAMRPWVGRAGALALAAMLTLSPSINFFSRSESDSIPAVALTFAAVVSFLAIARRPATWRATLFGLLLGLGLSASPAGPSMVAGATAALAIIGAWDAVTGAHTPVRIRVWWERRQTLVIVVMLFAIAVWLTMLTAVFSRSVIDAFGGEFRAAFGAPGAKIRSALLVYPPIFAFYEFLISLGALGGIAAIISLRIRSRFAAWAMLWTALAIVEAALFSPVEPRRVAQILIPMAILGALAIDWLHHRASWSIVRYPVALLAALELHILVITGFVHAAPDASEAPWARHALLFWYEPATTTRARFECRKTIESARPGDSVAVPPGAEAIRWYLRNLPSTPDSSQASIAVRFVATGENPASTLDENRFALEESWTPDLRKLSTKSALRFFFQARPWTDVTIRDVVIEKKPAAK